MLQDRLISPSYFKEGVGQNYKFILKRNFDLRSTLFLKGGFYGNQSDQVFQDKTRLVLPFKLGYYLNNKAHISDSHIICVASQLISSKQKPVKI
jgi:hypothetical protein